MTTMRDRLGSLDRVCFGGCGLSTWRHRRGTEFLGIIHFGDRAFNRRAAKRLLVMYAQRVRREDPEYLNSPEWTWLHIYLDSTMAQALARTFGFRLPSRLFKGERALCERLVADQEVHLWRHYEYVRGWLRG